MAPGPSRQRRRRSPYKTSMPLGPRNRHQRVLPQHPLLLAHTRWHGVHRHSLSTSYANQGLHTASCKGSKQLPTNHVSMILIQRCAVRLSYRSDVERVPLLGASRGPHDFPLTLLAQRQLSCFDHRCRRLTHGWSLQSRTTSVSCHTAAHAGGDRSTEGARVSGRFTALEALGLSRATQMFCIRRIIPSEAEGGSNSTGWTNMVPTNTLATSPESARALAVALRMFCSIFYLSRCSASYTSAAGSKPS